MMFCFFTPYWRRRNDAMESYYDNEKKPRKPTKIMTLLRSCFGHGFEVDSPSRDKYQRASDPATGFVEGEEVYGIQAEYLDEEDMAWGKTSKSTNRARRRKH